MIMSFGDFIFEMVSAPMSNMTRNRKLDLAPHKPINKRPRYQNIGLGEDVITVGGVIRRGYTGTEQEMDNLAQMMAKGEALQLIKGEQVLGLYILDVINETHDHIDHEGKSRKVDFTLTLRRQGAEE